ncbi:MAG: hypothetical protein SFZ02_10335 [bacterium]|nr:hypothetical protein [bacterium]
MIKLRLILIIMVMIFATTTHAQTDDDYEVITPENVDRLTLIQEFGQNGSIGLPQYSPNGATFAVEGSKGVWLYDAHTFELIRLFEGMYKFAYSPDNQFLSLKSYEHVEIWNIEAFIKTKTFPMNNYSYLIRYSSDGQNLFFVENNRIVVKSVDTGEIISQTEIGYNDFVHFNPLDDTVLVVPLNDFPQIWRINPTDQSMAFSHILKEHIVQRLSANFSPDSREVIIGTNDGMVYKWDVETGDFIQSYQAHEALINSLEYSPDGTTILTTSHDQNIRLWDVDGKLKTTLYINDVVSARFSPDSKNIIARAFLNQEIQVWDIETEQIIERIINNHGLDITAMTYSPDGRYLALAGLSGIKIVDVQTGEPFLLLPIDEVTRLIYSSDGRYLAVGRSDHYGNNDYEVYPNPTLGVQIWDVQTGVLYRQYDSVTSTIAFSPNGQFITIAGINELEIYNVETDEIVQRLPMGVPTYSPDGQFLAVGNKLSVILWSTDTYIPVFEIIDEPYSHFFHNIMFSSDGERLLIAAGNYDFFFVWDLTAQETIIRGRFSASLAYSPNGKLIGALRHDGALYLYDAEVQQSWEIYANMETMDDDIRDKQIIFSPDGKKLLVANREGHIRIYGVSNS